MRPGSNKARKEASKRLGLKLYADYKRLATANGEEDITAASIVLGSTFNENIEFIINVLKHYGGMEVKFEPLTKPAVPPIAANDLPDISALTAPAPVLPTACTCAPLEAGIIGRDRHMTSCPQFQPN
jgi:hypothetical protein